jgi:DNA modification methylase
MAQLDDRTEIQSQGIYEVVSHEERREMETDTRTKRENQCSETGSICPGRKQADNTKETIKSMGVGTSRAKAYSTAKLLQDKPSNIHRNNGQTTTQMRNMRDTIRQSQDIPICRPLPQNGQGEGVALHKLQPGNWENEGLTRTIEKGRLLPRNQCVIWCGLDNEQKSIEKLCDELGISYSSVYGSLSTDEKENRIESWLNLNTQILISKPKICGFGLNLQQASNMIFFGINDSWETFYQCVRREWRYGQTQPVNVYILMHDAEEEFYQNIQLKDAQAKRLRLSLIAYIKDYAKGELKMTEELKIEYKENTIKGDNFLAMMGDSCLRLPEIADNSIDLSVYSPPFADLFTYSASDHDLGNSKDWPEFFEHYAFIIKEILRVTKPGRLTCVHTSDIPAMANRDGYIGIKDFPGEVIRAYEKNGWTFIGRAFVQKNPQAQAIRTKSKALLFVQMRKDSADSRPALIDQVLIFKKPGENAKPITPVDNGEMDNETWIEWAHGIWLNISETDTLQFSKARGADDEKHICPLQLGTIERCIKLYSNPGEMVLTPFGGIGSEGYMAVKLGRKATLIELKPEYFNVAVKNLKQAEESKLVKTLL